VTDMAAVTVQERSDLEAARSGDQSAFARLVEPHRRGLHAHCYRMLGSVHDAEDALQDALLGAWRGLGGFEGRSSVRSWLYRIATNASIRMSRRRSRRMLAIEHGPAASSAHELGEPVIEAEFVEPYPDTDLGDWSGYGDPGARYELLESVELAFVAALQKLPATQRAVLVLRDVLAMPAAEVAETLDTSVASVNSALQRARQSMDGRLEPVSQQATRRALGDDGQKELVNSFVRAWERSDIDGIVRLLAEDARFAMPPLPAWFDGRTAVRRFFVERLFENPWKLVPMTANGQLAVACYMGDVAGSKFSLSSINVLSLRGHEIVEMDGFLAPEAHEPFDLPPVAPR
jgi:RNA polymerase sigma-70 factor (TIGR02960 family)